jgi:hypothetical protein
MRVADVLPIEESGIPSHLFSFALKSHFDFVVCGDNHKPFFAVEFDGPGHRKRDQQQRDAQKDELCRIFSFPMLRINSNYLLKRYNNASLLRWIISARELQNAFDDAQAKGHIPYDEPFDPVSLWAFFRHYG